MPRLNLDIFGSGTAVDTPSSTHKSASEQQTPAPHDQTSTARREQRAAESSVRFIPVGFHEKHLRLLDDAVHGLRRAGYYSASKSSIIRLLIEKHAHELEDVWHSGANTMPEL